MNLAQNITKESDPVSADTIHIDIGIRTFHPVSVSAFFIRNNRKITECILLCMFLCKGWLFQTGCYEQKTFWSFCSYMVRSCKGIEMLVNLINISYWYVVTFVKGKFARFIQNHILLTESILKRPGFQIPTSTTLIYVDWLPTGQWSAVSPSICSRGSQA